MASGKGSLRVAGMRLLAFIERVTQSALRLLAKLRPHLWVVPVWRAWLEAGLLLALLLVVVLPPMKTAPNPVIPATLLLFSLVCGTIAGLRLRLAAGPWRRSLLRDGLLSIPLALFLIVTTLGVLWLGDALWLLETSIFDPTGTLLVIGMCIPAFMTIRSLERVWQWWDARRQRRFFWALTHAQLMVVVLLGLFLMLVGLGVITYTVHAELNDLASLPGGPAGSPPYSIFMQVVIWLLGLAFLTLIFIGAGILLLFPLALVFSYLVGRGLTRRVEHLAQAAAQMQSGDLAVRVPVEGLDELAQLQENFNRMAANLQQRTQELEARTQELARRTDELQAERDRTAALLKTHRELAASVSHELRTPVATARTYVDTLLSHGAGDLQAMEHDLAIIAREVDQLERLIADLFTLSRLEIDRLSLAPAPVQVGPLLQRLVETVEKPAWEQRRVQVSLGDADDGLRVFADPARLEQMLRNLVQNSLRHTPPGGYVLVSAEAGPEGVIIRVEDSGEGIDPADLPHIWERFYRSGGARQAGEGSGLGLALVKELALAMGGAVGVESCPGQGSTFWIQLPACDTIAT